MPRPSPTLLASLTVALVTLPLRARAADPADLASPRVYVQLPVLEVPFNTAHGGRWPAMGQSLWLAAGAYEVMHTGLRAIADPYGPSVGQRALGLVLVGAADLLTLNLPPLLAWQHEEWHRAVMANRGIGSFDDIYRFRLFDELVSVSHVRDEDLVGLKLRHPADQVRLGQA